MGNDKKKTPVYPNSGQTYNQDKKRNSYQNNRNKYTDNQNNSKSKVAEIMEGILEKGYKNKETNILRKELVSIESEKIAIELTKSKEKLSNSQLRAFFNEINKLKLKYIKNDRNDEKENQEELGNLAIELLILKSKLEYRRGKSGSNKLPENFYIFMKENIDYIVKNDKKIYFKDFKTFFETVLGYMYGLGGINNR